MKYHLLHFGIILHHLHIQTAYMHWTRMLNTNKKKRKKEKKAQLSVMIHLTHRIIYLISCQIFTAMQFGIFYLKGHKMYKVAFIETNTS